MRLLALFSALALTTLGTARPAFADEEEESESEPAAKKDAAPKPAPKPAPAEARKAWDAAIAEKFLEGEFPSKVIEPAVARTLARLFLSEEEGREQAREAVQAAMSTVARKGRELMAEMFEAIVAKDRAAYETALASLTKTVDQRTGYWERAVAKFFPDLTARGRPLVRVGVARSYTCSNAFLGRVMGLGEGGKRQSAARALRRSLTRDERREACTFVRRWAEERAVAAFERVLGELRKVVQGEKVELPAEQQKFADRIKRLVERELVTIVGEYREGMSRIRAAGERLAEELPAAKKEEPKPAEAPPAPAPAP